MFMGLGPIVSAIKILYREKLFIDDFGAIGLKEAFAAEAISYIRELYYDMEKPNPIGSGISLVHFILSLPGSYHR